jgi:alpha-galactosidase
MNCLSPFFLAAFAALAISPPSVSANDNGLGLSPPLGWRSWNLYGNNVNQTLIMSIMKGMASRTRTVDGKPTSLCDLGYCDVGLDDHWQACGSPDAAPGMHYHDKDGNPIVNETVFPDFKQMTDYAHSIGLTSGWYGNNCDCSDHCSSKEECDMQIKQDVAALHKYGFDAWKLDGCGGETDLVTFNKFISELGKPIMVENCHWGSVVPFKPDPSLPPAEGCPWNFYRSSGDVRASYASVLHNLATVAPLHQSNLSYPGCWAYPDMLQVGCKHGPGGPQDPGLSPEETRSHFGAWAIVSSPLTLSHDVWDDDVSEKIWPVIANTEVLGVNQAYDGDSGGVYESSSVMTVHTDSFIEANDATPKVLSPSYQYLYKPIGSGKVAVLLMNSGNSTATLTADFSKIPGVMCGAVGNECNVRDIWNHKDLGAFATSWSGPVESHDAAFLVIQ